MVWALSNVKAMSPSGDPSCYKEHTGLTWLNQRDLLWQLLWVRLYKINTFLSINTLYIRLNQCWPWYCPVSSPVDLKSIPVNVPATTVLRSSSAPLAFSMATPNTLYKRAVEKPTLYYYARASTIHYTTDVIFFCTSCLNTMHFLPTDPSVLAHDAPCRVTMFKILNITKASVKVELWVINNE